MSKDHCDFNFLQQGKPCIGGGLCMMCKIPLHCGWQHVTIKGKPTMIRKFIDNRERDAIIASKRQEIAKLEKVIAEFEAIPSREQWEADNA